MILSIPDDYQVSERVKNATPEVISKILDIGEFVYFEAQQAVQNNQIESRLEELKDELNTEKRIAVEVESAKTQVIIDTMKLMRTDFEGSLNSMRQSNEYQSSYIQQLQNKLNEHSVEAQQNIISKIESLLGSGNTTDNITKGDFGESYVLQAIEELFPKSNMNDVSGNTASGDLMWEIDTLKCLVEVKNVAQSRNLNVDKFVRDVGINVNRGKVNCGLFVSLKTETIPTKGRMKLEFVNGVPVLYIANVFKSPHLLKYSLTMMKEFQESMSKVTSSSEEDLTAFVTHFNSLKVKFEEQAVMMENIRKNVDTLQINVSKMQKSMEIIMRDHAYQMRNYQHVSLEDEPEESNVVTRETCIAKIIAIYNEIGKWPSGKDSGISEYHRRTYKYSSLIEEAKRTVP